MITDPEEITRKLAFIARLTAEELQGWKWAREFDKREPFPGEIAALRQRERELGVRNADKR